MSYHVTRQSGYYDTEPRIEIATALDEISPGMLVAKYNEEGEYDTATEAVEAALALNEHLQTISGYGPMAITTSSAASMGLYPSADDGMTEDELREWARKRDEADRDVELDMAEAEWDQPY